MPDFAPDPDRKVLLIGWDGADWKTITPLLDAGLMPSLQGVIERGVMGNIATLSPPLSPMLWTSIATGKTADKHGVLGFTQPSEDGTRVQPVLGTSRKVKAVWNILNQLGLRSNLVGWWPSHPAEPVNGVTISDFYHRVKGPVYDPSPMPTGTVHPSSYADLLSSLRVHPQELTAQHMLPFVPDAETLPPTHRGLGQIAKTLAEAATIQAASTFLLEHTEWDFMAIYLDAVDHFGHGFMKYRPPYRNGLDRTEFEAYKGVMDAAFQFHDMMLGRLLELAGDDATVILMSDHGFHPDHLRPDSLPEEPAGPAYEHREYGIFVMAGPGIQHDERVYGASLLDVAPTLLALYGLPIGRDMDGAPLVSAFETPPDLSYIDSWEEVEGEDGMHSADARSDPWAEQEAMQQLVELGYVDADQVSNVDGTIRESQYYLAQVHLSRGNIEEAAALLEPIFETNPEAERYGLRLVDALRLLKRFDQAEDVLHRTAEARLLRLERQIEKLDELMESHPNLPEERKERLRSRKAYTEKRLAAEPIGLAYYRAHLLLAQGHTDEAIETMSALGVSTPNRPVLDGRLGEAYLTAHRWAEAEASFRAALSVDSDRATAHRGVALAALRQGRPEEAMSSALDALALRYHYPAAHLHLGEALMHLGEHTRAAQALEVSLAQDPSIRHAHVLLSELYRIYLDDPGLAAHHAEVAAEHFHQESP